METKKEVQDQLALLEIYRRNLAAYRQQQAQMGILVPPNIINGIAETREQISQIKVTLRQWGVDINDHPDDSEGLTSDTSTVHGTISTSSQLRKQINPQILVALIAAAATIIVALISLIKLDGQENPSTHSSFQYQVRVQSLNTGDNISNARVTIEIANLSPIDVFTDTNGYTQISIDTQRVGKPARILIEAKGYQKHEQLINLTQDSLPDTIKLELIR